MRLDIFGNSCFEYRDMDETIAAIDTITLRIPLDIWAPAPMAQGVPRTHMESLYVRVTTSGGVVGWGSAGPA
jgi:L-alanine-DL-glutamate epimerase-like enolase superfamily enzyme